MIPAPLHLIMSIRTEMQAGRALPLAIKKSCASMTGPFSASVQNWLLRMEAGRTTLETLASLPELNRSPTRRALIHLLDRGLRGASISENLIELESELYAAAEIAYERQLQLLPIKLLAPLTLFILPSLMILIAGPLLYNLQGGFL